MFRTVPLPTISSVLILLASCQQTCMTYTTAVCTVKNYWWWNCPKHVEFYSKNKFEKLVHLVGFIIRMRFEAVVMATINMAVFWSLSHVDWQIVYTDVSAVLTTIMWSWPCLIIHHAMRDPALDEDDWSVSFIWSTITITLATNAHTYTDISLYAQWTNTTMLPSSGR